MLAGEGAESVRGLGGDVPPSDLRRTAMWHRWASTDQGAISLGSCPCVACASHCSL